MYKGKIQLRDLSKELQSIFANVASSGGGVAFLRGTATITSDSSSVEIPVDYDNRTDTLLIHRNSVWMEINRDYTIAGTHIQPTGTEQVWHASVDEPGIFNFILLKAVPASDIVVDGAILIPGSVKPDAISSEYADKILKYMPQWCGTTTGSAQYIISNPKITSYYEGLTIRVKIGLTSTGLASITINSLGAKSIKDGNGNQLKANGLRKDSIVELSFNGQDFILQGKGGGGNATPADVRNGKKFTNDDGEQTGNRTNANIATELGITMTADKLLKGYVGLDKFGNTVTGTIDGIKPATPLFTDIGYCSSGFYNEKFYSSGYGGNNVGSGNYIAMNRVNGGQVWKFDLGGSRYYGDFLGFTSDGKYFIFTHKYLNRGYHCTLYKVSTEDFSNTQLLSYSDGVTGSPNTSAYIDGNSIITLTTNVNSHMDNRTGTTIVDNISNTINKYDINGAKTYTSPTMFYEGSVSTNIRVQYNQVGITVCNRSLDGVSEIVLIDNKNSIFRSKLSILMDKIKILINYTSIYDYTQIYLDCLGENLFMFIISLRVGSNTIQYGFCINTNFDILWYTTLFGYNSRAYAYRIKDYIVCNGGGPDIKIFDKNGNLLNYTNFCFAGPLYRQDEITGDLLVCSRDYSNLKKILIL